MLTSCLALCALAGTNRAHSAPSTQDFARRAEEAFQTNRVHFQSHSNDLAAAWNFARVCFDWADFTHEDRRREEVSKQGIAAAKTAIQIDPRSAAAHYYLGLNLGQLARTKSLGALKLVDEMEVEFTRAIELDPNFDNAGPDRSLGMLYFEAPGWPTSIGNKNKARVHLERTISLAPDFPENRLALIEAYLKWGDKKGVEREKTALAELLPKARKVFTGPEWDRAWRDWDSRWSSIRQKIQQKWPKMD